MIGRNIRRIIFAVSTAGVLLALCSRLPWAEEPASAPAAGETSPKADYVGTETCLSCHADYDKHTTHGRSLQLKKNIGKEQSCETCHGPGSLHAQSGGDKSTPEFSSIRLFKRMDSSEISATCLQCHGDTARTHWQGGKHDSANVSCISCHSVHQGKGKGQLVKGTEAETCFQCHSNIKAQIRRTGHMPVAEGGITCTSCHNPHDSGRPAQIKAASVSQLCYSCHQDRRGPFLFEHAPVRENCLTCHAPHGSVHENMLVMTEDLLCQRCHNTSRHPSTLFGGIDITGGSNRALASACRNCHVNIHGSNHPSGKFFLR